MNKKLLHILNALISNLEVLNCELVRLYRSEQFEPDPVCSEMIKRIRMACMTCLDNVQTLDRALYGTKPLGDKPPH
ncbi:MAG: hypothetical protein AB7L92_07515 [Alphaproteobacteria bacterium]